MGFCHPTCFPEVEETSCWPTSFSTKLILACDSETFRGRRARRFLSPVLRVRKRKSSRSKQGVEDDHGGDVWALQA